MTEPAEDEVDRLLRSGHDVLPESYSPTTTTRRGKNVVTTQQGSALPRSPAFRKLGQSIARTDQDVIHRVRSDIGQLRNRTQKIQKAFESARLRRKRASKKVNAGVRVSRNRMDPRYLRERGPQFYKERLVETLRKLIQKQWLRRWDVIVRAIQYEEMEQRRREEERERKRHAAIMLSKLLTFHYSFYMRWAKRRRFLRWFDRMMIIRRRVMAISARKIQSLIRGHLVRAERRRMHLAAIVIQKHARAKIARRFVRRRRAAIKLQRTFRHFLRMSRGARKIQSGDRMWSIRRAYVMLEREARERRSLLYLSLSHTHTHIQTYSFVSIDYSFNSLDTHTHNRYTYARNACLAIQGWYQGLYWRLITRKAVRVLQPWWRSKMNSRSIMIRRIQKTIRGYLQYSKYAKGRWSVICIQSYVRMQYRRRKYKIKLRKHKEALARKRALLADRRRERKNRFLFREARKICGNLYIVSVQRCPHETVLLEAYSPARQVVFSFKVKKSSIRITSRERLLRDAASGKFNSRDDVVDDHVMYV
jgi:hypothetical protein